MVLIAQRMLDAAFTVDTVAVAVLKRLGVLETIHTVKWGEGVQSGALVIEAADKADYAGTWQLLETVTFDNEVPAPKVDARKITGPYPVVRHRVSEPVDGGTVTTRIDGSA